MLIIPSEKSPICIGSEDLIKELKDVDMSREVMLLSNGYPLLIGGGSVAVLVGGPPAPQAATVPAAGTTLVVNFDYAVYGDEEVGWTITSNSSTAVTVASATGEGTATLTLTLSRAVLVSETLTIDYDAGTGNLRSGGLEETASFTTFVVSNLSEEGAAPEFGGMPTIEGDLEEGATLTPVYEVVNSAVETLTWFIADDDQGANEQAAGSTAVFILSVAHVGKYIKVSIEANNVFGSDTAESDYAGPIVAAPSAPTFPTPAAVSGTPTQNQTLSVSYVAQDSDSETLQWYTATSSGGAGESPIGGATSGSYVLQASDVGDYITCKVTATNATGSTTSTAVYVGAIAAAGVLSTTPSGYNTFVSKFNARIQDYGEWWNAPNTSQLGITQFPEREMWLGFVKAADHFNNATYSTYHQTACDVLTTREPWLPGGSNIAAYNLWTEGFLEDWLRNGDTSSRDTVKDGANTATYAAQATIGGTPPNYTGQAWHEERAREVAYVSLAYMYANAYCGNPHKAKLLPFMNLQWGDIGDVVTGPIDQVTLSAADPNTPYRDGGHIEQWLASYVTDGNGDYVSGTHGFAEVNSPSNPYAGTQGFGPLMAWYAIKTGLEFNRLANNTGTHNGTNNSASLKDTTGCWYTGQWVGRTVQNLTDGSSGTISANNHDTITVTLSGGMQNDWDTGDSYRIVGLLNNGAINGDARILPKAIRIMDAAWNTMWREEFQWMKYRWTSSPSATSNADLNLVVFPAYAYLYLKTGQSRHRIRAEKLFNGALVGNNCWGLVDQPNLFQSCKQWSDAIRHTFHGLQYYADGVVKHGT